MYTNRLKSGERVYLHKWGDNDSRGMLSRVELHCPVKKEVQIYAPQVNGRPARLTDETYYDLRMFGEVAEYRFKVKFLAHDEVDGFAVSRFKLMNEGEKSLRRDSYRLNLDEMIMFSIVQDDGHQSNKEEGKLVDLSVGGVKIYTNLELSKGDLLNLSLQLDNDLIIAFGDIKFAQPAPPPVIRKKDQPRYDYQYGLSFVMLTDSDEEKIIQFVYRKKLQEIRNSKRNR